MDTSPYITCFCFGESWFGSALNLNIHFHTLIPDGVFVETDAGYIFCRQSSPSHEELTHLAAKIHKKVLKYVETMGLNEDFQESFDEEGLGEISSLAIANKSGFGERAGRGIRRFGAKNIQVTLIVLSFVRALVTSGVKVPICVTF